MPETKDEVLDIVDLLAEMGNAAGKAAEDGKFTLTDLLVLGPVGLKVPAALSGFGTAIDQMENATPEQLTAWGEHFASKFDIPQDKAEAMAEDYLAVAIMLGKTIKKHHFPASE